MTEPSTPVIRVLLVDDHPLVRDGLCARMERLDDIRVVGEAGNAPEALQRVTDCQPSVVLMDIGMPGVNGIELTQQLLARDPGLIVLMLSMYDSAEHAQRAMAVGARGYVLKDSPSGEILTAIRTVAAGGTYLSPAMAARLFRAPTPSSRTALSEREQEILSLLGQGQSSKHIARVLDIGVRTVETHRQNIRRKLDLAGQAELIKYAVEHAIHAP